MNFNIESQSAERINESLTPKKATTNNMELESRKVFAKYWSTDGVFYYCMEINKVSVCRRSIDSFVNGTKLLNAANLTRGRRDGLLKKITNKFVVRNGIAPLRGVWIPLHVAQDFARLEDIEDVSYPLLEEDLEDAFKNNPEFVNAISKKMKNFKDNSEPVNNMSQALNSPKESSVSNVNDIANSLKENISTESLMKFVKSEHNQNFKPVSLKTPAPLDINVTKSRGSSSVTLPKNLSNHNLYPTPRIMDANTAKFKDEMIAFKDEKSSIKSHNDETVFYNETSNSTRVMTPISKIINNNPYASGTDITGNTNTRTVINTPHGYMPYSIDSLSRKPFDVNPHVYGHLVNGSARLNNQQPHYMMYQQPGNMVNMPVFGNSFHGGEDHMIKMYGSPLQQAQKPNMNHDDHYYQQQQPYLFNNFMNAVPKVNVKKGEKDVQ